MGKSPLKNLGKQQLRAMTTKLVHCVSLYGRMNLLEIIIFALLKVTFSPFQMNFQVISAKKIFLLCVVPTYANIKKYLEVYVTLGCSQGSLKGFSQ